MPRKGNKPYIFFAFKTYPIMENGYVELTTEIVLIVEYHSESRINFNLLEYGDGC
jgi:hypothetical protein